MKRNHLAGFAVAVAILGVLVLVARVFFEIVPETKYLPPSREAMINDYLALDRWLAGMGRPPRVENSGDLLMVSRAEERQIFIQSSLFEWSDEAVEYLVKWVEDGGNLFLALDDYRDGGWNAEEPLALLEHFGIKPGAEEGLPGYTYDMQSPEYDGRVSFEAAGNAEALCLKDWSNVTRLIQVKRENGTLTVSGRPRFLYSVNIGSMDTANTRLAWALFAPRPEEQYGNGMTHNGENGLLFIRGRTKTTGLLGSLFRHGNPAVPAVSLLVLLVIGFWTVIPGFGLVRLDEEKPAKSLRERFLAEGRFLKRYEALGFYRDMYIREIRKRLAAKEGISSDEEIRSRVLKLCEKTKGQKDSRIIAGLFRGESFSYRDFPKVINILESILERI